MMVKNKTNKNYKRSQKGRSMVEMLGVLAIVGVLSVGGVYGYGVAMKKHKANELLHQASMLATTISAQIASGKTDLALENFGNSSNGSFSSVKGPDGSTDYQSGDDKFTMQITGMDSAVCKQMQGMKGGTVRSVSCGTPDANGKVTATLTYNKDLSSTPVASDYNDDTTGGKCEGAGYQWCDGKCKTDCCDGKCTTGQTCVSGTCMNSECENSDCSCSTLGKNLSECSSDKPYCVYKEFPDTFHCVASAEGVECVPDGCKGTDAPYCNWRSEKCSKNPEYSFCLEDSDCTGLDVKFCRLDMCYPTAVGFECMSDGDCGGDAPYCDLRKGCSKEPAGIICYPDRSVCKGTSTPFCGLDDYCSASPEGAHCDTSSDCEDPAPYCVEIYQNYNSYYGCSKSASGIACSLPSDCKGTDAPYCNIDGVCSKDPENARCDTVSDCGGLPYCAPDATCRSTMEGALCMIPSDCVDTDAPYCNASNICSKTQEYGGFCDPGQDCGPGLSCGSEGRCE